MGCAREIYWITAVGLPLLVLVLLRHSCLVCIFTAPSFCTDFLLQFRLLYTNSSTTRSLPTAQILPDGTFDYLYGFPIIRVRRRQR